MFCFHVILPFKQSLPKLAQPCITSSTYWMHDELDKALKNIRYGLDYRTVRFVLTLRWYRTYTISSIKNSIKRYDDNYYLSWILLKYLADYDYYRDWREICAGQFRGNYNWNIIYDKTLHLKIGRSFTARTRDDCYTYCIDATSISSNLLKAVKKTIKAVNWVRIIGGGFSVTYHLISNPNKRQIRTYFCSCGQRCYK